MADPPLVSVIVPVYNGSDYLGEALDSALSQSYASVEVLVVNDGSTDAGATARVGRRYGDRIRYFEKSNGGVASALNLGIREMRGDWFCWLSHDDIYLPRRVEAAVNWLSAHPSCRACYSGYRLITATGEPISDHPCPWYPREEALRIMMGGHYIGGCTMTVHRSLLHEIGSFDEGLRLAQDTEMWLRIMERCEVGRVPEILVLTRVHAAQDGVLHEERMVREGISVYRRHLNIHGLPGVCPPLAGPLATGRDRARALIHLGDTLLRHRRRDVLAVEMFREALATWPSVRNPARWRLVALVRQAIMEPNWRILLYRWFPRIVTAGRSILSRFRRGRSSTEVCG
jgi:glycosyltransferase involved in cell wall biosynthesis